MLADIRCLCVLWFRKYIAVNGRGIWRDKVVASINNQRVRSGPIWAKRLQLREAAGYQAGLPRLAMLRYPAENGAQERT